MKKLLPPLTALLLLAACAQQPKQQHTVPATPPSTGDATRYGLVCDGSNDTIVVFLRAPYDGSDPDTLQILEASKAHQVFGTLRIGDRLAILPDAADTTRASVVIVTQDLLGQWCYKVKPQLRRKAGMDEAGAGPAASELPDSVRLLLEEEREYGFALKVDSTAYPIGAQSAASTTDEESPVEYPAARHYHQWYIRNGRLLLSASVPGAPGEAPQLATDTATLVALTPDTLVLRFADGERGYYRKAEKAK